MPNALPKRFDLSSFCTELRQDLNHLLPETAHDLARYRDDPVGYAQEHLGLRLTVDQQEILTSLVYNRRTAVKASHAVGKTFIAGVASRWWYDCWPEHIVYITAPNWSQALGLTFKGITRLTREKKLSGRILESGWLRDEDQYRAGAHYIRAINAESGEGFQGEHTSPILIILEEAVGVPAYIWEAVDGLMTSPDCRLLCIANPTDESTLFGRACSSPAYHVLTINGLEHANVQAELASGGPLPDKALPFPHAVSLTFIREMLQKECERVPALEGDAFEFPKGSAEFWLPNAVFQGRVLGEFPSQADCQVIPSGWLRNQPVLQPGITIALGCDVARHGTDRTTIAARSGDCLMSLREVRQYDTMAVAGALIQTLRLMAVAHPGLDPKKIPVRIDVTGGLGAGPADRLREEGYLAIDINASAKAVDEEQYPNVRSELWFVLRDRARNKQLDLSRLPRALRDKLMRELSTPTWKPNPRGQKVVEKKEDIKKRLGESPDLADATSLAYYAGGNWQAAVQVTQASRQRHQSSVPNIW